MVRCFYGQVSAYTWHCYLIDKITTTQRPVKMMGCNSCCQPPLPCIPVASKQMIFGNMCDHIDGIDFWTNICVVCPFFKGDNCSVILTSGVDHNQPCCLMWLCRNTLIQNLIWHIAARKTVACNKYRRFSVTCNYELYRAHRSNRN